MQPVLVDRGGGDALSEEHNIVDNKKTERRGKKILVAEDLEFAAAERRLEEVADVETGALAASPDGAGADQSVHLVNEQYHVACDARVLISMLEF